MTRTANVVRPRLNAVLAASPSSDGVPRANVRTPAQLPRLRSPAPAPTALFSPSTTATRTRSSVAQAIPVPHSLVQVLLAPTSTHALPLARTHLHALTLSTLMAYAH